MKPAWVYIQITACRLAKNLLILQPYQLIINAIITYCLWSQSVSSFVIAAPWVKIKRMLLIMLTACICAAKPEELLTQS